MKTLLYFLIVVAIIAGVLYTVMEKRKEEPGVYNPMTEPVIEPAASP